MEHKVHPAMGERKECLFPYLRVTLALPSTSTTGLRPAPAAWPAKVCVDSGRWIEAGGRGIGYQLPITTPSHLQHTTTLPRYPPWTSHSWTTTTTCHFACAGMHLPLLTPWQQRRAFSCKTAAFTTVKGNFRCSARPTMSMSNHRIIFLFIVFFSADLHLCLHPFHTPIFHWIFFYKILTL